MPWYYAHEGKQVGPVSDEQFGSLVASGVIQPTTLVWRDGMPNWQPYSSVAPSAPPSGTPPPASPANAGDPAAGAAQTPGPDGTLKCSNCGGSFSPDNLLELGGTLVCPTCKPIVVQRMREGVAVGAAAASTDPEELVRRATQPGRRLDVGSCFSRGWSFYQSNFWPLVGVSALVMLVLFASGSVPFVGSCISLVVTGPLMGGLYWYYLKQIRGKGANVGDAFSGFSPQFAQLMLGSLISTLLAYLPLAPAGLWLGISAAINDPNPPMAAPAIVLGALAVPVMLYLFVAWGLTLPLIIDKRLQFWKAMSVSRRVVTHHLGAFALLMLAVIGIMLLGLLAFCIGILFAVPLITSAYMYAYEDLFA